MTTPPSRGLPPRVYLPIVAVLGGAFILVMLYLIAAGAGVTGSVFGKSAGTTGSSQTSADSANAVQGGGPPAAVMVQLKTLRERITAHPTDDVAITQLADMYLTVGKFREAIPLYERALKVNPANVAAQNGLESAKSALSATP
ncbi:MAG: tetratricopeptide repeat protein [Candidatus Eremiobacteraeota bacterium]|nr:tetratricopeptide repeat protein [Candidatus Eremiobacteraeota bacterium]